MAVRIVWRSIENLLEESIGDRHASNVEVSALGELLKGSRPLFGFCMGKAAVSASNADASALSAMGPVSAHLIASDARSSRFPSELPGADHCLTEACASTRRACPLRHANAHYHVVLGC